mmetsp:Transcript_55856/g.155734  ORF Transcript_55856/g.155734 Transcript_55856/m.155734 type:complete len:338 (+) Transcript_55856:417-1430(+)
MAVSAHGSSAFSVFELLLVGDSWFPPLGFQSAAMTGKRSGFKTGFTASDFVAVAAAPASVVKENATSTDTPSPSATGSTATAATSSASAKGSTEAAGMPSAWKGGFASALGLSTALAKAFGIPSALAMSFAAKSERTTISALVFRPPLGGPLALADFDAVPCVAAALLLETAFFFGVPFAPILFGASFASRLFRAAVASRFFGATWACFGFVGVHPSPGTQANFSSTSSDAGSGRSKSSPPSSQRPFLQTAFLQSESRRHLGHEKQGGKLQVHGGCKQRLWPPGPKAKRASPAQNHSLWKSSIVASVMPSWKPWRSSVAYHRDACPFFLPYLNAHST